MISGKQIAEARKARGLTQTQLANRIGVSTESVSKWEKGVFAPAPENEEKLYHVLGIPHINTNRRNARLFYERNMSAYLKGKFNSGDFPESIKALSYA